MFYNTPFIWSIITSTILLFSLAFYTIHVRGLPAARPLGILLSLAGAYSLIQGLATATTDLPLRITGAELSIIPLAFMPVAILLLALDYFGSRPRLIPAQWIALFLIPFLSVGLSLTSASHSLFRFNYQFVSNGSAYILRSDNGPFVWVYYCFILGVVGAACFRLVNSFRESRLRKRHTLAILAGILLPVLYAVLELLGVSSGIGYTLLPIVFAISGVILARALLRSGYTRIMGVVRHLVYDHLADPVIVINDLGQLVHYNAAAQAAWDLSPAVLGKDLTTIPAEWAKICHAHCSQSGQKVLVGLGEEPQSRRYELTITPIPDGPRRFLGYLFALHDVTALIKSGEEMQESKDRLNEIIRGTNIGTWEWNVQTGEAVFNERWAQIVGYTLAELAMVNIKTWENLAHPDDLIASKRLLQDVFARKRDIYDIECRMAHRNGTWVWVHDRGKVFEWTEDGKPLRMAGSHADITERKQMEAALHASELRYRVLFETLPTGVTVADETGQITESNRAAERILGMPGLEQNKRKIDGEDWTILRPDGTPMPPQEYASERALKENKPVSQVEMGVVRGSGGIAWISVNAAPLAGEGVVVTYEDISARKEVAAALQENEKQFHAMFEKNTAVMLLIEPGNGQIVDANSAAADFYGYPLDLIKRMQITEINTLDPEMVRMDMAEARADKRNYFIFPHRLANGEIRQVEVYSSPLEIGGHILLHSIVHDISGRKRAEEAAAEQRALAEALRDAVAALNSTLNFDGVLDRIIENVSRVVPHEGVGIYLLDSIDEHVRIVRQYDSFGISPVKGGNLPPLLMSEAKNLQQIIATGKPVLIANVLEYPGWVSTADTAWVRSNLTVPILIKGTMAGFLSLNCAMANRFTMADADRLQAFADQAAVAIENARLYEETHERSITDPLTGVFNRHGLSQLGAREVERAVRFGHPLSVLLLDIDHFKTVNDTYGHLMGDRVLAMLADICQAKLRGVDVMARYGGDEFIFLLPETGEAIAIQIGERLLETVAERKIPLLLSDGDQNYAIDSAFIKVTASLGVASLKPGRSDLEGLISDVDQALYTAKLNGRNQVATAT